MTPVGTLLWRAREKHLDLEVDGGSLPGDAGHALVIDGLSEALDGIERAEAARLSGTSLLTARQVRRLEQGMGRAIRSNEDYCVVFLLGARLAERLHGPAARASFSPATRAQIELSEEVGDLIEATDVGTLRQAARQCLDRDPDWLAASRGRLATLRYGDAVVAPFATGTRAAPVRVKMAIGPTRAGGLPRLWWWIRPVRAG